MHLRAVHLIWLIAGYSVFAAEADRAIVQVMRSAANGNHVRVLQRTQVETELDLVIALAAPWPLNTGLGDGAWWSEKADLGLFLQHRDKQDLVYRITTAKGLSGGDCYARVERATKADVVISCAAEKGRAGPNRKFVFDVRAKALVKQMDYDPFSMSRLFLSGDHAVMVGWDYKQLVVVEYNPANPILFRVLQSQEAERWKERVRTTAGTVGAGAMLRNEIYLQPEIFKPVNVGLNGQFTLTQDAKKNLLVVERGTGNLIRHELPQPSYEEFKIARPGRVKDGYSRAAAKISGAIGPWQIADGTVWFGKSFYDGEGSTGVGGFGYFDCAQAKYRIYSPPEVADLSVTAILVESDAVWLGLARHGEWGSSGGQLVRFDRACERVEKFELREIAAKIARVGDRLLIATEFGAAVVEEGKVRRFFVDQMTGGGLRVVEGLGK